MILDPVIIELEAALARVEAELAEVESSRQATLAELERAEAALETRRASIRAGVFVLRKAKADSDASDKRAESDRIGREANLVRSVEELLRRVGELEGNAQQDRMAIGSRTTEPWPPRPLSDDAPEIEVVGPVGSESVVVDYVSSYPIEAFGGGSGGRGPTHGSGGRGSYVPGDESISGRVPANSGPNNPHGSGSNGEGQS